MIAFDISDGELGVFVTGVDHVVIAEITGIIRIAVARVVDVQLKAYFCRDHRFTVNVCGNEEPRRKDKAAGNIKFVRMEQGVGGRIGFCLGNFPQ